MLSKKLILSLLFLAGVSAQAEIQINPYELVGTWKADNCSTCYIDIMMYNGELYGDMDPWGSYGYSYSQGPQPIYIYGDEFMYRGDAFRVDRIGYNGLMMVNTYGGGNYNVDRATKLSVRPSSLRRPYFDPRRNSYPVRIVPIDRRTGRNWDRYPGTRPGYPTPGYPSPAYPGRPGYPTPGYPTYPTPVPPGLPGRNLPPPAPSRRVEPRRDDNRGPGQNQPGRGNSTVRPPRH